MLKTIYSLRTGDNRKGPTLSGQFPTRAAAEQAALRRGGAQVVVVLVEVTE